jgi:hypothetical protein
MTLACGSLRAPRRHPTTLACGSLRAPRRLLPPPTKDTNMELRMILAAAALLAAAVLLAGCTVTGAPYFAQEGAAQRFPDMAACEREANREELRDRDRAYQGGYVCRRTLGGVIALEERRWWLGQPVDPRS